MSSLNLSELLQDPALSGYLRQVDQLLIDATNTKNLQIRRPAQRLIKAGGKRLRPALTISVAQSNSKIINDKTIRLAVAVELVHIGSLVHDDIIDEAASRWKIPTINALEGQNQAIIIGDYLFAAAFALASGVGQTEGQIIAKMISELCDGQIREVTDQFNSKRSIKSYLQAIEGKTAALLAGSCILGGLVAGFNQKQLNAVEKYGRNFGLAFQIVDDLMDFVSNEDLYRKQVGNDVIEGIYTLPVLLGLKSSNSQKIKKLLATKRFDQELINLLLRSGVITETLTVIKRYNQQAAKEVMILGNKAIEDFPDNYLDYVLTNLVDKNYRSAILQMQKM